MSMVRQSTDDCFAKKAISALEKVHAVLPTKLQGEFQQITTFFMPDKAAPLWNISFSDLRESIRHRQKVRIIYTDDQKRETQRTLRPLALVFFSPVWLLVSWCEKRNDFRSFRLDRIQTITFCAEIFEDEEGKNLSGLRAKEACF